MFFAFLGAIAGAVIMATVRAGSEKRSRPSPVEVRRSEVLLPFELERGIVAYEAYRRGCAGIAPETRAPLPNWRELHPDIQTVWVEVANAVCERFQAIA